METPLLRAVSLTKDFSGVTVLNKVTLEVNPGEILGLIGENGAGKSTFIKILCGIYQPSSGFVELGGKEVPIADYLSAKKLGIALVPQEFNLINTLNVYENIFLGNEIRQPNLLLDKKAMRIAAAAKLNELSMPIAVDRLVSDLSVAEKQLVEISKALLLNARILIMDEPTTTLTGHEVKTLFDYLRSLQAQGVTIIFVSHKLHEITELCNRVAVLRDGELISIDPIDQVNEIDIARKMIGRDFQKTFPPKRPSLDENPILEVHGMSVPKLLHDVSFNLRRGEVLGFAGLVGAGRTEVAETLIGIRKGKIRSISVEGREVTIGTPRDAVNLGIGYLSEDRQGKGIVQDFDIPKNITLISLRKYIKGLFIDKTAEFQKADEYIASFRIVASSKKMALRYFSGGNQQKVYLSRWVDTNPKILFLDEPTRGIDVNAKKEIYEFIHSLTERGISCVVISSEMEEVIGLCTRVYVMKEGHITGCLEGNHINEEEIMFYATGIKGDVRK